MDLRRVLSHMIFPNGVKQALDLRISVPQSQLKGSRQLRRVKDD